jgi:hypothetical protein
MPTQKDSVWTEEVKGLIKENSPAITEVIGGRFHLLPTPQEIAVVFAASARELSQNAAALKKDADKTLAATAARYGRKPHDAALSAAIIDHQAVLENVVAMTQRAGVADQTAAQLRPSELSPRAVALYSSTVAEVVGYVSGVSAGRREGALAWSFFNSAMLPIFYKILPQTARNNLENFRPAPSAPVLTSAPILGGQDPQFG